MKKFVGFVSGIAAVGLMGTGIYMLMSDNTKKQMCRTMESAIDDANKMMDKKKNAMKQMINN